MSTHEHTPQELEHALQVIRSECRAHPEDCTECPLSFSDDGPIQQCGITDHSAVWHYRPFLHAGRMGHCADAALAGVCR